jgi:tRNA threonylcarbamoyladenosine biosynthesis protein TsaE
MFPSGISQLSFSVNGRAQAVTMVLGRIDITDLRALKRVAEALGEVLKGGDTVFLKGGLGAGKTTFCRFVINHLMLEETLTPSPTFSLMHLYDTPKGPLWHVDLYRLTPEDVPSLGLDEQWQQSMMLIEWPERLATPPADPLHLDFEVWEEARQLVMRGSLPWAVRLTRLLSL